MVIASGLTSGSGAAAADIALASRRWPHWLTLAWYDFVLPYRRTLIGPLWQMLYIVVWAAGLSILFISGERGSTVSFVTYVICGVTFFSFIENTLSAGGRVFPQRESQILNVSAPLMFHVYRQVVVNAIKLGFQIPVVFATALLFIGAPTLDVLWFVPGLLVYLATSVWATLLFAIVGARYRDVPYAVSTIMRFLFFMSPVFWVPAEGTLREVAALYNPITYFLEILRAPVLGEAPSPTAWIVVLSISAVGFVVTYRLFSRLRRQIPFWL